MIGQSADPASLLVHELRLAWRDMVSLLTARGRWRLAHIGAIFLAFFAGMHFLAWTLLQPMGDMPITHNMQAMTLLATSLLLMAFMMLSQSLESVTRLFYSRGDLDLIMSAPLPIERFFLPRLIAISLGCWLTALPIAAPFIHVLAIVDTSMWLCAYLILLLIAGSATAISIWIAFGLLSHIDAAKTRLIAQILAATIGAFFVIGLQLAAILHSGGLSRIDFLTSSQVLQRLPHIDHWIWWGLLALRGHSAGILVILALAISSWWLTAVFLAPRFQRLVLLAQGQAIKAVLHRPAIGFSTNSVGLVLILKEWILLARDPWLISQSLMQILYLLPPAAMLYLQFGDNNAATMAIVTAVLIMSMGQLAGGLGWLALSGEDARELIATAPVHPKLVYVSKIRAVLILITMMSVPFVAGIALVDIRIGLLAFTGIVTTAISTVCVQLWFQGESSRRQFRRRQTTSRIAAFAEALVSIGWAATFGIAVHSLVLGSIVSLVPILVLIATYLLGRSPAEIGTPPQIKPA